ncbi:hypothetical protein VTK56DRAFT_6147 [Thermocarpiscus australiensis]
MSRVFRPLRTILGSRRLSRRLESGQVVHIERVKIKKGGSRARFLGATVKGALVLSLILYVTAPLDNADEDSDDDDEPLFIPFPLTTKKVTQLPYRASDPEWQQFVRISKDPEWRNQIQNEAAQQVLKLTLGHPLIPAKYGKDMKLGRVWLDIDFPLRPPPVYERSGILITDEGPEWTTMPVSSRTARFLEKILWPRPAAISFWTLGTVLLKQKMMELANYLGFGAERTSIVDVPRPPLAASQNSEIERALGRIRQEATRRPEEVKDPSSLASPRASPTDASKPRGETLGVTGKPPLDQRSEVSAGQRSWGKDSPRSVEALTPWQRFFKTYSGLRVPNIDFPPRGCVVVSGLVEIETSRTLLHVSVLMYYDPKTRALDQRNMHVVLRKVIPKELRPLM